MAPGRASAPTPWCFRPATEQARAVLAGSVSSQDLVRQHIERIERLDGQVNAVVVRIFDRALARAAEADAALARREIWGPLHGVPITVKEAFMLTGTATTSAIPQLQGCVAEANALAVQRLLDAGAVILGKTNLPPYCADIQTANPVYGRTCNPHDLSRTPGGSSGGSATALACGFAALELGSDVGGSIRTPAHFCGVCGHKPSYGIGHLHGHAPGATHAALDPMPKGKLRARFDPTFHHQLAVAGPLARCCADLELAMRLLARPDPSMEQNGWSFRLPQPRFGDARPLRAAAWLDTEAVPTDREYLGLLEAAVSSLEAAGARVDRGTQPLGTEEWALKALGLYARLLQASDPAFSAGKPVDHQEWLVLEVKRNFVKEAFARFFEQHDVLLCPVAPIHAFPHTGSAFGARTFQGSGISDFGSVPHMLFWAGLFTLADLPSTVVPVGRTTSGLPCGIQIVAGNFQDLTTIAVGKMLEECHAGARYSPPAGFDDHSTSKL